VHINWSSADIKVVVERGAGTGTGYPDAEYQGRRGKDA